MSETWASEVGFVPASSKEEWERLIGKPAVTEIARLAARVAYLEQENARLASEIIRVEGELEAESRREK